MLIKARTLSLDKPWLDTKIRTCTKPNCVPQRACHTQQQEFHRGLKLITLGLLLLFNVSLAVPWPAAPWKSRVSALGCLSNPYYYRHSLALGEEESDSLLLFVDDVWGCREWRGPAPHTGGTKAVASQRVVFGSSTDTISVCPSSPSACANRTICGTRLWTEPAIKRGVNNSFAVYYFKLS